ncbi:hypothetical protein KP509_21G066600 [Ceratopteris richardii]|uniref:Uncharacterized protein n=1 Tax=Ceratopteris richardii TaxID=49495 RepID=A0A8T2SEG4_CERRI|nr:hypothetical protein KP509_21G066600 [Ceratopteris richardii]
MPRHDFHRSKFHSQWCRSRTSRIVVIALVFALFLLAWLTFDSIPVKTSHWKGSNEWQGGPVAFPWEDDQLPLAPMQDKHVVPEANRSNKTDISLRNIVFNVAASAHLWSKRKEYLKLWWRPDDMVGFVWLDEKVNISQEEAALLPQVFISEDISKFRYTNPTGQPSGIRIARIIREAFELGLPNVHWFVLGDDDTVFSPYNLMRVLRKYDYKEMYYIGNPSESHASNTHFSHGMAFGGGGIAISYALAQSLSRMLDECLERYTSLIGSDDRLHACITELGVPLTKEIGFHQFDVHGNIFGLLSAHPIAPFISIHHLDEVDPVFPKLDTLSSLRRLAHSMHAEPSSFLQHSICYDREQKLSLSVSLGYAVQVFPHILLPRELERPEMTFKSWNSKRSRGEFDLDTRWFLKPVCNRPVDFYIQNLNVNDNQTVVSTYKRDIAVDEKKRSSFCLIHSFRPEKVQEIQVVSKALSDHWFLCRFQEDNVVR